MQSPLDDVDWYEYWGEYFEHHLLVCSIMRRHGVWSWMVKVSRMDKRMTSEAESLLECRSAISDAIQSIKSELA